MSELKEALDSLGLYLTGYYPNKQRSIKLNRHPPMQVKSFCTFLVEELKDGIAKYPQVSKLVWAPTDMAVEVEKLAEDGLSAGGGGVLPEGLSELRLYCDMTASRESFFTVTPQNTRSHVSGAYYLARAGLSDKEAAAMAIGVVPEYLPRSGPGVSSVQLGGGEELPVFNTYVPPKWMSHKNKTAKTLPDLFERLVRHLIPLKIEREYLYSWIYHSLYDRALVYLVLCGIPGAGKNTLKAVITALHGHSNHADGKRSTLDERFNSQLVGSTLIWFDELEYNPKLENTMKELQNETISIERKGIDTTRSTPIYASTVITNNKPRDNFLSFDARKFAPLVVREKQLGDGGLTPKEISTLLGKVNERGEDYDIEFVAQIGNWIKNNGRSDKWKKLEYHGPMFYKLAHISMFQWQKLAIEWTMETDPMTLASVEQDPDKGFVWSSLRSRIMKRQKDRSIKFPEATSVEYFFRIFKDAMGKTSFKTEFIEGNVFNDFWVKPLSVVKIVSEVDLLKSSKTGRNKNGRKEVYDL